MWKAFKESVIGAACAWLPIVSLSVLSRSLLHISCLGYVMRGLLCTFFLLLFLLPSPVQSITCLPVFPATQWTLFFFSQGSACPFSIVTYCMHGALILDKAVCTWCIVSGWTHKCLRPHTSWVCVGVSLTLLHTAVHLSSLLCVCPLAFHLCS